MIVEITRGEEKKILDALKKDALGKCHSLLEGTP